MAANSYTAKEAADYILKFAATLRWSGNFPAADGIERAVNALLGPNEPEAIAILREIRGGIPPWLYERKRIDQFLDGLPATGIPQEK